jgi:quercetin dioxygenase-like cupin family protein
MTETTLFSGRVFKRSLPFVGLPPAADAPRLKRLALAQGELAQIHDGEEGLRYLAYLELRAGSVRGNHYHKIKKEWTYVISGKLLLLVEDIATRERVSLEMHCGDLAFIGTGIAHALRTIEPGGAVEFSQAEFNAADIYPYALDK